MSLLRRSIAEFIGTFWLVLMGCGSAVIAANTPNVGVGHLGIAFAFGLTVLTMAYTIGPVSGAHVNPAVTVGLWAARRFPATELASYVIAQVLGAIAGALVLLAIASGKDGFSLAGGLGANGYGAHSPDGYSLAAGIVSELVMTFMFVFVILGATDDKRAPKAFAGIAIGLALTLIHIVTIPVTGTSVNPARSTGPAIVVGGWALRQLWVFWLAPLVGAALAGVAYRSLTGEVVPAPPLQGELPGREPVHGRA